MGKDFALFEKNDGAGHIEARLTSRKRTPAEIARREGVEERIKRKRGNAPRELKRKGFRKELSRALFGDDNSAATIPCARRQRDMKRIGGGKTNQAGDGELYVTQELIRWGSGDRIAVRTG